MKNLKISKEISLPLAAVTETFAAIGRRGAGKTYLATMIAEQMLDARAQVVVIDPVGVWWGLRVAANGTNKGKEIFVIGGEHGDVQIVPDAGKRIAQVVVDKGVSVVIDVSGFRISEYKRFSTDFAEEFFHLKKAKRAAVHLFVEEAQKFIPQRAGRDEARMLGAFESIVRLGRNYGIGCTLVTQRPQSVNKEVLSQVECLFVLQVTGLHERKAIEGWVQEKGADRKMVGELPGLERGEGYVWSPAFLRTYQRVNFAKKTTFDASATPEVGKAVKAASISAVDVEKLKKDMEDVIEKAQQDDPAALRKRIKELELELKKGGTDPQAVEQVVARALAKQAQEYSAELQAILINVERVAQATSVVQSSIVNTKMAAYQKSVNHAKKEVKNKGFSSIPIVTDTKLKGSEWKMETRQSSVRSTGTGVSKPQQRILDALAWLASIGITEADKRQLAFLSDQSPKSSGYSNNVSALRTAGLLDYPKPGAVALTDAGRSAANEPDTPLTTAELHEQIRRKLSNPQWNILHALISAYPEPLTKQMLADLAGASATSSGFSNNVSSLRTLGLLDYPVPGEVRAEDLLFI